ncbi:MAG: preprotein translocase subunit SecA [Firmicutes bacterium]|nr:preprotein translocase subunit SecA [Bacillota bacterium]HQD40245.1 preprotein translocase subunit SecA [Bacillota bacterium]
MFEAIKKLFDHNERELRRLRQIAAKVEALRDEMVRLSDEELAGKTPIFRSRLEQGESLDDLLPEAFAVVREAARRTVEMEPFPVQIMGGIVLHEGKIAEMKTGEGKTLVATMPVYLNALTGRGVHVVTVNDYLAKRDAQWMGEIYKFLGLSVGVIVHGLNFDQRKEAYNADVTYGTNNEFGFDYLRDNMVFEKEQMVQRHLAYAIVDEVDSILIDEARTPLIISGPSEESVDEYYRFAKLIPRLKPEEDYTVDEKAHSAVLTEAGVAKMEKWLGVENLFEGEHVQLTHYLNQALKAHTLMKRDRDYVVKDGQVIIVDEFTGRLMFGRRYSDGLHQAIEAKEGVKIERESQTLATITFQNYFRMYDKLAGMTGTAATEEEEFRKIYGLDVVVVPTHKPMIRKDFPDVIYKTEKAKFEAVVEEIQSCYERGQPTLVGTISIEKSELLSKMLKKKGIPHEVLNAKHHEREAEIVALAGQRKAVTIATNMAGRGTDIVLGEGVKELGGLHIIGTERHESRRIDNQLRGRSGRQGDPGSSRFYVSLEDDLMRLFGSERISSIMERFGWEEHQPIEHPYITRSIENAQKRVEAHNFQIRKQVLEYDNVMNKQREVIYRQRRQVLEGENLEESIKALIEEAAERIILQYCDPSVHPDEWDLESLLFQLDQLVGREHFAKRKEQYLGLPGDALKEELLGEVGELYQKKEEEIGSDNLRQIERYILLQVVDRKWMEHLRNMDELKEGIGLRAYGQRNPLQEYQLEAYYMFNDMMAGIGDEVTRYLFRVTLIPQEPRRSRRDVAKLSTNRAAGGSTGVMAMAAQQDQAQTPIRVKKIGRNDPCPCGSGKKYKKCCGR